VGRSRAAKRRRQTTVIRRRTGLGAPPGSLQVDPAATPTKLRMFAYSPEQHVEAGDVNLDAIRAARARWPVVWVDAVGVGSADVLSALAKLFDIHPLALEDVVNVHQRPKIETYPGHHFIVLRMVREDLPTATEQFSLWVSDNAVVTFQERPGDCLEPVRDRIRRGTGRVRKTGADYLAYALVDAAVDRFFPVLERHAEQIEALEDEIVRRHSAAHLDHIHTLRRELLGLRRVIWSMREALGSMLLDPDVPADTHPYWRDCHDHCSQLAEIVEACRDLATSSTETYLSFATQRMNEVMKVLTMIATLFIPLSFVAGVYGMNFDDIPGLHSRWGFAVAVVVMLGIAAVMLLFFRRRGWLVSRDRAEPDAREPPP
jgi:magnesium transporter